MRYAYLLLATVLLLPACDAVENHRVVEDYVVESYQEVGAPLAPVRLGRTAPVGETYDFSKLAISGADVWVYQLAEDGSVEREVPYRERSYEPGVYDALRERRVEALTRYALEITLPDGHTITAETFTPGAIEVVALNTDSARYQSEDQFEVRLSHRRYDERQAYFIFTAEALHPSEDNLTPFSRQRFENDDATIEDLRIEGTPPLSEANYAVNPDETITVRLPWLAFSFYGPSRLSISALDDNLYDFLRSQGVQQGGSTLAPGEIPNVLERVVGGTGVFGSFARASQVLHVLP